MLTILQLVLDATMLLVDSSESTKPIIHDGGVRYEI